MYVTPVTIHRDAGVPAHVMAVTLHIENKPIELRAAPLLCSLLLDSKFSNRLSS
jgi:hypothetical protein